MTSRPQLSSDELEISFGAAVRSVRQRQRLTQLELAQRANVSLSALKYLETGRGSSLATLVRIARALERTEWLEQFSPPRPAVSPMELLRDRQRDTATTQKRVRHRRKKESS